MDDGEQFPRTFNEWEKLMKRQMAEANALGFDLIPVTLDPEQFVAFCRDKGLPVGGEARARYAIDPEQFVAFCRDKGIPVGSEARARYAIEIGSAQNSDERRH